MPKGRKRPGMMYVYALCEPDLWQAVRYVGASEHPAVRLTQHLSAKELHMETPKAHWLKELKAKGVKPILRILEEVDGSVWEAAETKWIAYYRQQGAQLTNLNNGGMGATGKHLIGRKLSPSHMEKLRQIGLQRRLDPPDSESPEARKRARDREKLARFRQKWGRKKSA